MLTWRFISIKDTKRCIIFRAAIVIIGSYHALDFKVDKFKSAPTGGDVFRG